MKKALSVLAVALCLLFAGCAPVTSTSATSAANSSSSQSIEPTPSVIEEVYSEIEVGGGFHADPIYGVFRGIETGEIERHFIGQINYYDEPALEEYAETLSLCTGLNFAVEFTDDELGVAAEWLPEATIFDTDAVTAVMEIDGETVTHTFEDNNALRWFMLDSLAETLYMAHGLRYTMDGGKDLVLDGLTPVDTFRADEYYVVSWG